MSIGIALVIAAVTLALLLSGKLDHMIAGLAGGILMLGVGIKLGFYNEGQALEAIEFDALALLLGMMILVSILEPTGFFQYMAIKAG
ncbi:MAG: hypothetical protein IIC78_03820 [Chloroflexi bacterium]|nr:hypothetical protein [Chloroflexota bacterium]